MRNVSYSRVRIRGFESGLLSIHIFINQKASPPTLTLPLEGGGEGRVIPFGCGFAGLCSLCLCGEYFLC